MKKYFIIILFFSFNLYSQTYIPGKSYFGRNNYTEYIAGSLPIIISASHGGYLTPENIPDRTCNNPTTVRDTYTQELLREIDTAFVLVFNCHPHLILSLLDRKKLDANRNLEDGACGNQFAMEAWDDYHNFINIANKNIKNDYQKGFYIDLHGHGHPILRLELGYLFSANELAYNDSILNLANYVSRSGIRNLVSSNKNGFKHSQLLRGEFSFGTILNNNGFASVPSSTIPFPLSGESYFSGGYNTSVYSSVSGGTIDGVQIESHYAGARDKKENRRKYALAIAKSLKTFLLKHTFNESDLSKCVSTKVDYQKEINKKDNYTIYPNPSVGEFMVNFQNPFKGKINLTITNLLGQTIFKTEIASEINKINLPHNINQGIYFVKIENGNEVEIKKLIISFNK